MRYKMKKNVMLTLFLAALLTGCGEYSAVQKSADYDYRYEVAKANYAEGKYSKASQLLGDLLAPLKGTQNGEESLYMIAQCCFKSKDYETASTFYRKYYQSYPKGEFVEQARYGCGYSLYKMTPDPRLDQSSTMESITEFQNFLDLYPHTSLREQTTQMIYALQDKLVEKEFLSAKLYYDLGSYVGNMTYGGSNHEACVVTAENALKDYPYASSERREEFAVMIVRAKYQLAMKSVEEKRVERFRSVVDECYAFRNDYPESTHLKEVNSMLSNAESIIKKKHIQIQDTEETN